jgi:hypothetical protein
MCLPHHKLGMLTGGKCWRLPAGEVLRASNEAQRLWPHRLLPSHLSAARLRGATKPGPEERSQQEGPCCGVCCASKCAQGRRSRGSARCHGCHGWQLNCVTGILDSSNNLSKPPEPCDRCLGCPAGYLRADACVTWVEHNYAESP